MYNKYGKYNMCDKLNRHISSISILHKSNFLEQIIFLCKIRSHSSIKVLNRAISHVNINESYTFSLIFETYDSKVILCQE